MASDAIARNQIDIDHRVCIRLRRTLHLDLNGLPIADCLGCADVALCVSIHCCRPVAAVGVRAGRANPSTAGAALAWLRLLARLSSAAEQHPSALCPKRCESALGAQQPTPLVY